MRLIVPETRSWNFCCLLSTRVNKITKYFFSLLLSAYMDDNGWMSSSKMKFLLLLRRFSVTMGRKFFRLMKFANYFDLGVIHKERPDFLGSKISDRTLLRMGKTIQMLNFFWFPLWMTPYRISNSLILNLIKLSLAKSQNLWTSFSFNQKLSC